MSEFVDVVGASGTSYRFRRTTPPDLPAMAGNLVVASGPPDRLKVLLCGAADSLAHGAPAATELLQAHRDARLYVRLNVARAAREAEHADIVAGVAPAAVVDELG